MRRTIKIDDDVAAAVERLRTERGMGISEAVNFLARAGLREDAARPSLRPRSAKIGLTVDVGNIADALQNLDGPSAR
jgi:Arc/MetJ family transcription regulator